MQQLVELFPDSPLFATEPLEASGIYDRELPHGHRWLQRLTKLLVKPVAGDGSSAEWVRLTLSGPTWIPSAWIVVRVDGAFSGVAEPPGVKEPGLPAVAPVAAAPPPEPYAMTGFPTVAKVNGEVKLAPYSSAPNSKGSTTSSPEAEWPAAVFGMNSNENCSPA